MNQENFKLEYKSIDNRGCKFRIWSGPSVKGNSYQAKGVDPNKDRVFYIQVAGLNNKNNDSVKWQETYRFKYNDQIKLLELVLKNKQLPNAKVEYILWMIEKLISWMPENYRLPPWHRITLEKVFKNVKSLTEYEVLNVRMD